MAKTLLVVNPQASAVSEELAERVEAELGDGVETAWTERPGHAAELVQGADADAVVIFGGDGAFNEALNGLRPGLPIGLVPGGGSSVLPRALGLPRDPREAAGQIGEALRAGRTRRISLGRVNGRRFGFAAALGFPAEVVRRVDDLGRERHGRRPPDRIFLTTVARVLRERRGRLAGELEVEGHGRAAFALVANGDPYTYLWRIPVRAAPRAAFDLGLDLVAPRAFGPVRIPVLAAATLTGRTATARGVLYLHDQQRIEILADRPLPLQVDGEDLGDVEKASFVSEPGAADILV